MVMRIGIRSRVNLCFGATLLGTALTLSACGDDISTSQTLSEASVTETGPLPPKVEAPLPDEACQATLAGEEPLFDDFLGVAQYNRCKALEAASDAVELQQQVDRAWAALSDETLIFEAAAGPVRVIEDSAQSALELDQSAASLANGARIATQQLPPNSDQAQEALTASGDAQAAARLAQGAQEYITYTKSLAMARYAELRERGETGSDEGSFGIDPLYFIIALLAAIALGALFFLARRDSGKKARKKTSEPEADTPRAVRGSPQDSGVTKSYVNDELAKLESRIGALDESITERFKLLAEKIDELSAAQGSGDIRTRNRAAPVGQEASPPRPTGAPTPPPSAPTPTPVPSVAKGVSFLQSPEVQALISEVNNATKQDRLRGGSTNDRVRTFSSDSINAPHMLFEDATDRFWLLTNPGDPNEAALVPGMTIRNGWGQMMRVTHDHPLGHHFELKRGDSFTVKAAALLRKEKTGWELVTRGVVSGVS
ncbi:MAG: hypothetical protein AAGH57_02575 [Pseudomonadota bacterium]